MTNKKKNPPSSFNKNKAKDFKGTAKMLIKRLGAFKWQTIIALTFAVIAAVLNVL